jgi:hypothetical protein
MQNPPGVSQPDAPKNFPQLAHAESRRENSREYYLISGAAIDLPNGEMWKVDI